jgi:hypothetical protein
MDSFADIDPAVVEAKAASAVGLLPNLVDATGFYSCPCVHGVNNELADVFYNEFDEYNKEYR